MTFYKLLEIYSEKWNKKEAFVSDDIKEKAGISANEFCHQVLQATAYFQKCIGKNKRVAILGENSYSYLVLLFGLFCSGNIAIPLNPAYSDESLWNILKRADAEIILGEEEYRETFREKTNKFAFLSIREIFEKAISEALAERKEPEAVQDEDVMLLLLSSGTGGNSKLVQISQENLTVFPMQVLTEPLTTQKKVISALPFYHISGIIPLLEDMMRGNVILISSAKHLVSDICQNEAEKLIVVPAMMKRILKLSENSEKIQKALENISEVLCLGAPIEKTLALDLLERGIVPHAYYGMTETTGTVSYGGSYKIGASGKTAPFNEVKIKNGEILVRGRNVTKGYYGQPEQTKELLSGGWLHTGDLGRIDEEGYLYVKGRCKNIIVLSNGENVSCEELETLLLECSLIEECLVFYEGECIKAKVYCGNAGEEVKPRIYKHLRSINKQLPLFKKIKEIIFCPQPLKKNAMGKLVREENS